MLELHCEPFALNNEPGKLIKPVSIGDQRSEGIVVCVTHISSQKERSRLERLRIQHKESFSLDRQAWPVSKYIVRLCNTKKAALGMFSGWRLLGAFTRSLIETSLNSRSEKLIRLFL